MPRGGYRKGAGRKREYQEPVQKILLGLPQSVLQKLDDFARQKELSRPKAIALLLETIAPQGTQELEIAASEVKPDLKPIMPEIKHDPEMEDSPPKPKSNQALLDELRALKKSLNT